MKQCLISELVAWYRFAVIAGLHVLVPPAQQQYSRGQFSASHCRLGAADSVYMYLFAKGAYEYLF